MGDDRLSNILGLSREVICFVGPTASGKSEIAQRFAETHDGEVVSADSMQIYRGMDIGTGKVPEEERRVPHHGLNLVDPGDPFSAALFQSFARTCFSDIDARGKTAVLCGGTGFYVRAAIDGYEFPAGEQVGNETRDHCRVIAEEHGSEYLWNLLDTQDHESAQIIPVRDTKRIIRAFELIESGTTYAQQRAKLASIPQVVPAVIFGLQVDPDMLAHRIDQRVDKMFELGLVDEVRNLLERGFRNGLTAPQAIGYKEIVAVLDGEASLEEASAQIKLSTRRYAKRQRTWFRKDKRIHWLDANELDYDGMLAACDDTLSTLE